MNISINNGAKPLTKREVEILTHLEAGKSSKQIAAELGISKGTVDIHRKNVLKKTHAKSTGEAVFMHISNKLDIKNIH